VNFNLARLAKRVELLEALDAPAEDTGPGEDVKEELRALLDSDPRIKALHSEALILMKPVANLPLVEQRQGLLRNAKASDLLIRMAETRAGLWDDAPPCGLKELPHRNGVTSTNGERHHEH
jgi:hypothetical protein